ncbi:MAG: DegT/DnrJ/EryC1/StrS family aminotransferase [Gemmatimonadales bacterium]
MRSKYLTFGAPHVTPEGIDEVVDSLRSGWLGTGPKVARFEDLIRGYTGAPYAAAVNSGSAALHLGMIALGIGPGDEVITTPMTFCATANSIIHCGATPVFVDCGRDTQLIDPERIEAAITSRTRAIIPVHMAGRICDMTEIRGIARRHDLRIVEDAAHALEGRYGDEKVGCMGDITCFSFYVTKNITTSEGGMLTTNDPELAERARTYSLHGMDRNAWKRYSDAGYHHYEVVAPGFKYNMTDIEAAIGIHQFDHIEAWLNRRDQIWKRYDKELGDLPVGTPAPDQPGTRHARHLYTLIIDPERCGITRDDFIKCLHERHIGTGLHFVSLHLHPWYRDAFGYTSRDFPNASWISERTVSIPLSPHLTDLDVDDVISAVREVLGR